MDTKIPKSRKQVTLDKDLVEIAEARGIGLSKFFNNCLKEEFRTADELEAVNKEILEHERILNRLRSKQCRLEKSKATERSDEKDISSATDTLDTIFSKHGYIAEPQILSIANFRNVNQYDLISYCHSKNYPITKGVNEVKKGKMKNGHGFY